MRKLIWLTLLTAVLVTSLLLVANVHASTVVNGTITQDTTWTAADSPYTLTSTVYVNNAVTLTIQPGVTVDLSSYSLQVNGVLNAVGTNDNRIVFMTGSAYTNSRVVFNSGSTLYNEQTGAGCIIQYAVFNGATAYVSNASPKISNCYFTNGNYALLSGSGGSPMIVYNAFSSATSTAISYSGGSPTISYNFIRTLGSGYGLNIVSSTAYISDNNITSCYYGVYVTGSNPTLTRNLISSCNYGVYCTSGSALIEANTISGCTSGIYGGGTIRNNTISKNTVGITTLVTATSITQNSLWGNIQNNVRTSAQINVDATNNWWGTTDASAINQTIYDFKNSSSLGNVTFIPFLSSPNPNTPALESVTYVPNPTPTAIPSPIPVPTATYVPPVPTNSSGISPTATPQPTPTPSPTPIPTPSPPPTPSPTPKIMPGSPLSLGSTSFAEALAQFDITAVAELVLMALGIVWLAVLLFYAGNGLVKKEKAKND
jgi:parallel beta-helix repeat protein